MKDSIRTLKENFFTGFVFVSGLITLGFLAAALGLVTFKGFRAVSPAFLFTAMREGGVSGGILYQIAGTVILALTTLSIVLPIAWGVALLRSVYIPNTALRQGLSFFLYTLNGIPSILFGIFGFFLFVKGLGWGKSWLTGGILLAMMILPAVAMNLSEGMDRIPKDYIENARALGLSRSQLIWSVLAPQSFSSFMSGLLLGLGRAAGETAPVIFTATVFAGAFIPKGITDNPVLSLPYHIFNLAQESYQPQALQNAWGSAFVLIAMVFFFNLAQLPFRLRFHEEAEAA